jgi:hypothetical protein
MKKVTLCFAVLLLPFLSWSSGLKPIAQKIAQKKNSGQQFSSQELFRSVNLPEERKNALHEVVNKASMLSLQPAVLQTVLTSQPENISLLLPDEKGSLIELELYKAEIFTPDFSVVTSAGTTEDYLPGVHYRGIIKGDNSSIASISIFEGEVMGLISSPAAGNYILGKLKNDPGNVHILYNDRDLLVSGNIQCHTSDNNEGYTADQLELPQQLSINCIRIYWELNYDLFLDKGSVAAATTYAVGLFNESATLYANDNIPVELSQVFVWNTASPYTGTNPGTLLGEFQSYRNSFNGDLGHLLGMVGGGGVAAGFNGLCNANLDNSQCFSMVSGTFQTVPVYSWSVEVVTHEQGHLMGSRHTHACVWNGNNTAIDGCGPSAGYPYEGNCSNAPIPPGGGTVMSYCHLIPTGINFSNGFGPQPAAVILNKYNNAACLSPCTGGSFCFSTANTMTINVGTTTADLIWESVNGASSYNIQYRIVGNIAWVADTSQDTIYHAIGLTPGSDYEWQVQTVCGGVNTSIFTSSSYFVTIPLSCDPPTGLVTTNISAFSVNFSWNAVQGALNYNLQYRVVGAAVWTTANTVDTFYHSTGLISNSNYEWQVQTNCVGGGISSFSPLQNFTTPEIGDVVTVILQPDGVCGKDALVGDNVPTGYNVQNFGDTPEFNALAWTAQGGVSDHRSFIEFDLSFIPAGSAVVSAYLSLYWNPTSSNTGHSNLTGPNDATLNKVIEPWDEHYITWMTQPPTSTQNQVMLPASTSNTQDYTNIDVTAMVQDFVSDPSTNYGMLLRSVSETAYHSLIFCSSDHPDASKRPKLVITYSPNTMECAHYQYSNCMGTDATIANCVLAGYDTSNFGDFPELNALSWTYSNTVSDQRALLYWNLNEIPANAIVDSALLSLFWNPTSVNTGHSQLTGPNDAYLNKITSPWSEYSVKWNNQPPTTSMGQVYIPVSASTTQDYTNMNVTSLVQDWVTNPNTNFGCMFQLITETHYRSLTFCSSDNADPALHPRLDICYHLLTDVVENNSSSNVYEDFILQELHVVSKSKFPALTSLEIYNVSGQLLRSFENFAGTHFVMGKDDLSAGVYFYRLVLGDHSENGKIIFR